MPTGVLAAIAIWISRDDGASPIIRMDSIGKHEISSGSAQQAIIEKLVVEPPEEVVVAEEEVSPEEAGSRIQAEQLAREVLSREMQLHEQLLRDKEQSILAAREKLDAMLAEQAA